MRLQELMEAGALPIYYFAYGMLTDPQHMPGAEFIGPAVLNNFQFELLSHANLYPAAGAKAVGVLWAIDRQLLGHLDQIEGYPHYYDRKSVPVFCQGQRYEADVYTMTPSSRQAMQRRTPTAKYVKTLVRGYNNAGLPLTQITNALRPDSHESR